MAVGSTISLPMDSVVSENSVVLVDTEITADIDDPVADAPPHIPAAVSTTTVPSPIPSDVPSYIHLILILLLSHQLCQT